MPGSPEHTANASLYFEKGGLNLRLSYNFASDFIDEMGESTFYDRYYDKVNYMDVNASYTFGKKFKTTFYAEANNLLNQPLRYYQGTKDRTMQAEYYGVKVNAGVKINFLNSEFYLNKLSTLTTQQFNNDNEENIPFTVYCPTRQRSHCPNHRLLHLRQEVQLLRSQTTSAVTATTTKSPSPN